MPNQKRSTIWVDVNGRSRQTILTGNATLSTVQADLLAISNADVLNFWEGPENPNSSPSPTAATYQDVADYASLYFQDGSGNLVYVTLPAPKSAIFLADAETVNPASIATLIGNVIGTVLTSGGNPVTAYVGGLRRKILKEYQ